MFPPSPQCSVPARYARLHYALGGGGKETKPTTNILLKVPNLFQDLTPFCFLLPQFLLFPCRLLHSLRPLRVEPSYYLEIVEAVLGGSGGNGSGRKISKSAANTRTSKGCVHEQETAAAHPAGAKGQETSRRLSRQRFGV